MDHRRSGRAASPGTDDAHATTQTAPGWQPTFSVATAGGGAAGAGADTAAPAIVLKVDVDTWRGTRDGVPALQRLFERQQLRASFLFSLGPDRTGRAVRRVLRPGFFAKVSRTSVLQHYGLRTLLYGTVLPAPDIGQREGALLRGVRDAGHDCGIHCWDHTAWQDEVSRRDRDWTRVQLQRAVQRYVDIFQEPPAVHGAAGWQMNAHAYALLSEAGFAVASDTRGDGPYQPVDGQGRPVGPPQLPTTLPTLDELIGIGGLTAHTVHRRLLDQTAAAERRLEIYTLHAELEGQRLLPTLERLIAGWRAEGRQFTTLSAAAAMLDRRSLPRHVLANGRVPGRSGWLAVQTAQ